MQTRQPVIERQTEPSRATRRRSLRGRTSHRGSVVVSGCLRAKEHHFESGLEHKALLVNFTRTDVVDVLEQPAAIRYVDKDGGDRSWTFDQLVTLDDGRRILVEVKPRAKAARKNLLKKLAHVAEQVPPTVATHVTTMDERDVPRAAVADARLFNAVRRDPPCGDDAALAALAANFVGAVSVASLVEASGLGARGFRAIARLVADGALAKVGTAALGYAGLVATVAGGAK